MQKNLKRKNLSDICLSTVGLCNPSLNAAELTDLYSKQTQVTESHKKGFRDICRGLDVFSVTNYLHMFTVSSPET